MQSSCSYKAVLIGNGTMGQRHKRLFEEVGVEFIGVVDTATEAATLFEQIAAGALAPDFAIVASPAVTHDEYVKKCIDIKLPVLVEKPVFVSAVAAMEYQKLALERNAFVFVGHSERYNPAIENFSKTVFFKEMREYLKYWYLQKKDAGPVSFKFTRTHGFSPRNRDVPVEYDLMIHDMDLLSFFGDKNAMMYKSFRCEELSDDRVHAFYDLRTLKAEFIADRNSAKDSRMVEISMNGLSTSLDLGAYRNGNPAYALQKEHQAFLNYLNSYRNSAQDEVHEYDWYGDFYDACNAVIMVSLIGEVYRKGRADESDAK
ncbi:Gfo/Idh/MocA family protein [Fibrobacter sp. UWH4]|uniref:Gfo/Idh/MocA family protein n=1 Tax=Fibrobacter sp. UWH4 TaxID=1896210 RepID=UPI0009204CC4|nr:Gfo/Idh/MocA family oxidoreductase [Fibrobacter sp. UWH4]SHL32219.1 Predicted dehydrogenase [Fibrobacter sp. UWH4]